MNRLITLASLSIFYCLTSFAQNGISHIEDKLKVGADSTTAPSIVFSVIAAGDTSQHIALIRNTNDDGNGLKIQIDGNHGMWIPVINQNGLDEGFYPIPFQIPTSLLDLAGPVVAEFKSVVQNKQSFGLPNLTEILEAIFVPNARDQLGFINALKLDTLFLSAGCNVVNGLASAYNGTIGAEVINIPLPTISLDVPAFSFRLPDLNLPNLSIPTEFPNLGNIPTIYHANWIPDALSIPLPTININPPAWDINVPDPSIYIPWPVSTSVSIPIPSFSVNFPGFNYNIPDISISSAIMDNVTDMDLVRSSMGSFNSAIGTVNNTINSLNSNMESVSDNFRNSYSQLQQLDNKLFTLDPLAFSYNIPDINIPIPDIPMLNVIGGFDCANAFSFDEILLNFPVPDIDAILNDALGSPNQFITFVDKADRYMGSVNAQHPLEAIASRISVTEVLQMIAWGVGLGQADGGALSSGIHIAEKFVEWYDMINSIGVTYESGYGDYAEWLPREDYFEKISYGDIIGIKGGRISKDLTGAEQIMVVSKSPIVMGNAPHPDSLSYGNNVAFIGQVPVKLLGPVRSGDFIIAHGAYPGYGRAIHPEEMTSTDHTLAVGRSWENNDSEGFKFVNTLVGMHSNAWTKPLLKMQKELDSLKDQQSKTDQKLEALAQRLDLMDTGVSSNND